MSVLLLQFVFCEVAAPAYTTSKPLLAAIPGLCCNPANHHEMCKKHPA